MAQKFPLRGTLALIEQPSFFLNSGDNKLIITGQPPVVVPGGIVLPTTKAVTTTGQAPKAQSGNVKPTTRSVTLSSIGPVINPGNETVTAGNPDALVTTGNTPLLGIGIPAPVGAATITPQSPALWVGLQINAETEGNTTPTVLVSLRALPTTVAVSFSSDEVERAIGNPNAITRPTPVGSNTLTGQAPGLKYQLDLGNPDALVTTGQTPLSRWGIIPAVKSVALAGQTPVTIVEQTSGKPTVIIGIGQERGTLIENTNAVPDDAKYNVCDESGWKAKPSELVPTWDGLLVLPEFHTPKHPLLNERSRGAERQRGALRREPIGDERFIEDAYPDGVDADEDL